MRDSRPHYHTSRDANARKNLYKKNSSYSPVRGGVRVSVSCPSCLFVLLRSAFV
uniref:Uncharacterized protein n=1 Tax=Anopheles albimanus TaxID=7167 RepID=A0A182FX81_ANOAL